MRLDTPVSKQLSTFPCLALLILSGVLRSGDAASPLLTNANPVVEPRQITVTTITVAPAIPSTAPQFVSDDAFTSAILNSTNFFRAAHNASAVTYNATLARFAADYLDVPSDSDPENAGDFDTDGQTAANCPAFEHSGGPYGENLALGCSDVQGCVDMWGNERDLYNFADPGFGHDTGHFTQLVWKNTTDVGCSRRLCGATGWYLVCEYFPRGNVMGQFGDEVNPEVEATSGAAPLAGGIDPPARLLGLSCFGMALVLLVM